ncbi:hypothetical protein [Microbulbifer sp. VAAF005]|nr:hypothetical protein [Microbulbifer sp. VAAF005]WHI48663.1 hypothetical protein P0078_09945 [Microbulbifer sp. VAAF005]
MVDWSWLLEDRSTIGAWENTGDAAVITAAAIASFLIVKAIGIHFYD